MATQRKRQPELVGELELTWDGKEHKVYAGYSSGQAKGLIQNVYVRKDQLPEKVPAKLRITVEAL